MPSRVGLVQRVSNWLCGTSSSVWGENAMLPFSVTLKTILTVLLAAVTEIRLKICNECWVKVDTDKSLVPSFSP